VVQYRPASIDDCDSIGLVTVSASHSAFIGAIPEEAIDFAWTPAMSAANWRKDFAGFTDRDQSFDLAEDDGVVLGFVWASPWAYTDGFDASIRALYVRPTAQRKGIGYGLLTKAVSAMRRLGAGNLEIGCVRENPSCGFYRRFGGEEIARRPVTVDRFETEEILFGWTDLATLMPPP
jgi:L-amino acid N-acyltransferase YncA